MPSLVPSGQLAPSIHALSAFCLSLSDAVKLDGSDPLLLEAYGAYGVSLDPEFSGAGCLQTRSSWIWCGMLADSFGHGFGAGCLPARSFVDEAGRTHLCCPLAAGLTPGAAQQHTRQGHSSVTSRPACLINAHSSCPPSTLQPRASACWTVALCSPSRTCGAAASWGDTGGRWACHGSPGFSGSLFVQRLAIRTVPRC